MLCQITPRLLSHRPPETDHPASGGLIAANDWSKVAVARRLGRDLDSLEQCLRAAERTASASRPLLESSTPSAQSDVTSRLAELERRELQLQERERASERQRILLDRAREKLHRSKDRLKRAIGKFRADTIRRSEQLETQQHRLAATRAELFEERREFAREQIRRKLAARAVCSAESD